MITDADNYRFTLSDNYLIPQFNYDGALMSDYLIDMTFLAPFACYIINISYRYIIGLHGKSKIC